MSDAKENDRLNADVVILEDGWGMRNLYPAGQASAPRMALADGSLSECGFSFESVAQAVAPFLPPLRRFIIATWPTAAQDNAESAAGGFGFGSDCWLKADGKHGLVETICFEGFQAGSDAPALRKSLVALDQISPLVISDDYWDIVGAVADEAFLDRYFARLTA